MEYLDIYDENGKPLRIKKSKKEAHDKGLWHWAVQIWVVNSKKEILMQKRSPLMDNYPNKWEASASGHVSAGEDDITSALRETEEEIGLKLEPKNFILIGTVKQMTKREGYINNEINPIYVVKMDLDSSKIKKQEEEVSEVKFMPYEELQKLVESKDPSFVPHPEGYKLLFEYISKN
jgi:isopentenyldiphosphate isomerase